MILNKLISLVGRKPYFATLNGVMDFSILTGSKVLLVESSEQARTLSQSYLKHDFELQHVLVSELATVQTAQQFDFIVLNNCINYLEDVQVTLDQLHRWSGANTRIMLAHSHLFSAAFVEAHREANNLSLSDVSNMLYLADFEKVRVEKRLLFPIYIPGVSFLLNKYISQLPIFNRFCSLNFIIARPLFAQAKELTVSVIVPARNEKGNIQNIVNTVPELGAGTELIFIEGHSSDDTFAEIQRVVAATGNAKNIKVAQQTGKGKGDAVRLGFEMATGDVLMILDADLTVPPDDLHKFYNAIASGKGEYINGSRMIYPQEKEAMRLLNIWGNRFFAWAFTWLLGQRITDTLCGTKVLSKQHWNKIIEGRNYFGDFDPFGDFDLILGATKQNLKFVEIPVRYKARVYGSTNISRFRHGLLLLRMVIFSLGKIKFR
jgi:hypothetical protein